jgi:small subunit ribosomal protein S2
MKDFVLSKQGGKIIDLRKTLIKLNDAYSMIKHTLSEGGKILFVGTGKEYIKKFIAEAANETKSLYVNKR